MNGYKTKQEDKCPQSYCQSANYSNIHVLIRSVMKNVIKSINEHCANCSSCNTTVEVVVFDELTGHLCSVENNSCNLKPVYMPHAQLMAVLPDVARQGFPVSFFATVRLAHEVGENQFDKVTKHVFNTYNKIADKPNSRLS